MKTRLVLWFGAALFLAALLVTSFAPTIAAPPRAPSPDAVIHWNDIAQRVIVQGKSNVMQSAVYYAYPSAAVYDALVAIQGGYQPYKLNLKPRPGASPDAAVAAAAYNTLVHYFPDQKAALDTDYANALAAIPDGAAKSDGIAVGQEAAAGIIADRQGDGLNADIGFKMPAPGPGMFQLPAGTQPLTPWLSKFRPFLLNSVDQFRPGPPPALNSPEWAKDYNEVKTMGGANSTLRTADQSNIAKFWTTPTPTQYNSAYKKMIMDHGLNAVEAARLYAMTNLIGADAFAGCFDAKYHYLFWRPVTAVAQVTTAENANTAAQPNWTSLVPTPGHPDYPSSHSCYSMAVADTLATFLGTDQINFDVTSNVPNLTPTTRHFATPKDLITEVQNARVWGGIHSRTATVAGAALGDNVAKFALARNFQPLPASTLLPTTGANFDSQCPVQDNLWDRLVNWRIGCR